MNHPHSRGAISVILESAWVWSRVNISTCTPLLPKSDSKLPGIDIHTPRLSLSRSSERAGVESYEGYPVYVFYVQLRLTTIW